jgi:hypothetical protein
MSLWEQPSFLVAFGLCLVCLSTFVSGTQAAQEARPGAIVFLILTALVYALYRSKLGWGAVPTRGWLPSRHFTRRRWFGLGIYFLLVVSVAGGLSTPRKAGSPGAAEAPWTKGMTATTCGDWLSVMTDRQRQAFAEALLAYDLSRPHGPALDQTTATEYASVITDTCRNDSPSSLVVQ